MDPEPSPPPRRGPGRPGRLTVEERRAAVLDAAVELFAVQGWTATSVDAVAQRAGVQKPAVYRLFPSKDDLTRAALDRSVDRFVTAVDDIYGASSGLDLTARIRARAAAIVDHVLDQPADTRLLLRAYHAWPDDDLASGIARRDAVLAVIERYTAAEAEQAGWSPGPAARVIATLTFALTEVVVELALDDPPRAPDTLAALLAMSMEGVLTSTEPAVWAALARPGR